MVRRGISEETDDMDERGSDKPLMVSTKTVSWSDAGDMACRREKNTHCKKMVDESLGLEETDHE